VETGDLEQAGRIVLSNALEHYNPNKLVNDKPVQFETYAIAAIRRGISRAIHDSSWSKAAADHEKIINKAKATLEQELGRPPTFPELAKELDVSEERLAEMISSCGRNRPLYLNQSSSAAIRRRGSLR
jgi:RNA polymerase sigma factor for flagellar operon FliA